jgi:hypothetical protein
MSLAEWQRDLAAHIAAPAGAAPGAAMRDLDGPGLALTRMLQRTWRYTRLTHALPLTMRALPADAREGLLAAYCDAIPCVSFFPVHEARSFARFLAEREPTPSHLASIAALEVALIDAFEADVFGDAGTPRAGKDGLHVACGASRVQFSAPPGDVLTAALAGAPLPPVGELSHELLVAPGIAGHARAPTAVERQLLDDCEESCDAGPPGDVAANLIAEQVLARA